MMRLSFSRTSRDIESKACHSLDAAYKGAAEIGSTVLSISISLVAVFIPILLMGGIVGRLFREFAVTLSVTILVSLARLAHHHTYDVGASAERQRAREALPG